MLYDSDVKLYTEMKILRQFLSADQKMQIFYWYCHDINLFLSVEKYRRNDDFGMDWSQKYSYLRSIPSDAYKIIASCVYIRTSTFTI